MTSNPHTSDVVYGANQEGPRVGHTVHPGDRTEHVHDEAALDAGYRGVASGEDQDHTLAGAVKALSAEEDRLAGIGKLDKKSNKVNP